MTKKEPHLCFLEIPANNLERAQKFYSSLFGWEVKKETHPAEHEAEYFLIRHKATPENKETSPIPFGGILKKHSPDHLITAYIAVSSVDEYVSKIKQLGGQILVPKKSVPSMGYFAICKDTENNTFAIWEGDHEAK